MTFNTSGILMMSSGIGAAPIEDDVIKVPIGCHCLLQTVSMQLIFFCRRRHQMRTSP